MKPEEQRIAIAKACGYPNPRMGVFGKCYAGELPSLEEVPDYLNDLNAMHEAEKIFLVGAVEEDWKRYDAYRNRLNDMVGIEDAHVATAAQRAEAFLRTLDLWTE